MFARNTTGDDAIRAPAGLLYARQRVRMPISADWPTERLNESRPLLPATRLRHVARRGHAFRARAQARSLHGPARWPTTAGRHFAVVGINQRESCFVIGGNRVTRCTEQPHLLLMRMSVYRSTYYVNWIRCLTTITVQWNYLLHCHIRDIFFLKFTQLP